MLLRYSFRRRPPQSNYPPDTVRNPDHGSTLEHQTLKGGISRSAPCRLASTLQSLPPILHIKAQCSVSSYSKGSRGSFRLAAGTLHLHSEFNFTESRVETAWPSYAIRAGRNLPDKEFRYLRTVMVTAAVYQLRSKASLALTPSINLPAPGRRHTVYVHFRVCTVLCF